MPSSSGKCSRRSVFAALTVLAAGCTSRAARDQNAQPPAAPSAPAPAAASSNLKAAASGDSGSRSAGREASDQRRLRSIVRHGADLALAGRGSHELHESLPGRLQAYDGECDSDTGASVLDGICAEEHRADARRHT